jgi:hypothetical protein
VQPRQSQFGRRELALCYYSSQAAGDAAGPPKRFMFLSFFASVTPLSSPATVDRLFAGRDHDARRRAVLKSAASLSFEVRTVTGESVILQAPTVRALHIWVHGLQRVACLPLTVGWPADLGRPPFPPGYVRAIRDLPASPPHKAAASAAKRLSASSIAHAHGTRSSEEGGWDDLEEGRANGEDVEEGRANGVPSSVSAEATTTSSGSTKVPQASRATVVVVSPAGARAQSGGVEPPPLQTIDVTAVGPPSKDEELPSEVLVAAVRAEISPSTATDRGSAFEIDGHIEWADPEGEAPASKGHSPPERMSAQDRLTAVMQSTGRGRPLAKWERDAGSAPSTSTSNSSSFRTTSATPASPPPLGGNVVAATGSWGQSDDWDEPPATRDASALVGGDATSDWDAETTTKESSAPPEMEGVQVDYDDWDDAETMAKWIDSREAIKLHNQQSDFLDQEWDEGSSSGDEEAIDTAPVVTAGGVPVVTAGGVPVAGTSGGIQADTNWLEEDFDS